MIIYDLIIFQVVFGSRNARGGSDGSGTLPKYRRLPPEPQQTQQQAAENERQRLVGQIVDEDLRRLRALDPSNNTANQAVAQSQQAHQSGPGLGWPVTNLSGILPNYQGQQQPSYSNLTAMSGGGDSTRLIGTDNLEIIRQRPTNPSRQMRKSPKLRASSPIDQNQPLSIAPDGVGGLMSAAGSAWPPMSPELSPFNSQIGMASGANLGHFDSELSSVPHLSSNERSIPSTLLTSPPTGLGSSLEATQNSNSRSMSRKTTSSGTMGSSSTGAGVSTMMTELGTIPEDGNFTSFDNQMPQPMLASNYPGESMHADVNSSVVRRPPFAALTNRAKDIERQIYWSRETYRNADALFPNYALNYPTPVHGSISPSRQYPPRFGYEQDMIAGVYPIQGHLQHPSYQYYFNPELQYQQSQPSSIMTNVFTTSQFAQPQQATADVFDTPSTGNDMPKKSNQGATTPLATSSPPISRRSHSYAYHNKGYSHDTVQSSKSHKYSAPAQLTSYPGNAATLAQGNLLSSPSQQLHDYENMRYSAHQPISNQGQPSFYSQLPPTSSSPPPIPMSRQRMAEPPQPPTRPKRQRDAIQNEGSKSQSSNTKSGKSSRERKSGAPSKLSVVSASKQEVDIPLQSLRSSTSQTPTQGDAVSLVSEVLDAEVTALTNSSSPGSSIGSGKHPRTPLRYYQGPNKKSKSSIASSAKEQQMLDQHHSFESGANAAAAEQSTTSGSSGIASKNTSVSQNQSTASAGTSSAGEGSKSMNENIVSDLQNRKKSSLARQSLSPTPPKDSKGYDAPSYENWPPLAPRKPAPMIPPQSSIMMPTTFDTYQQGIPLQSYLPQTSSGEQFPGVHSPGATLVPPLSIRQMHPQQFQQSSVMRKQSIPN